MGGGRICERREIQRRGKIERESMQRELQQEKTSGSHQGAERKTLDSAETLGSPRRTARILLRIQRTPSPKRHRAEEDDCSPSATTQNRRDPELS